MPKTDFIPTADNHFLIWLDRFVANLQPQAASYGLQDADVTQLQTYISDLHTKVAKASDASAAAKQATADKNTSRKSVESHVRALARRIKAHPGYTAGQGDHLGVEGAEVTIDLSTAKPILEGTDQTGGQIELSFNKSKSDGINIYCQREDDNDWVLLGRATVSPYLDKRPLLAVGKPELRRYTAIYMQKDQEVGVFSDDLVINCAP